VIGSAAEARFGILIDAKSTARQAFDETARSNRDLVATVERLISVSKQQARETHFISDALRGAAEEAKRYREEQERISAEAERQAAAQRKAAAETRAVADAQKAARDNMIEWGAAVATTGALLLTASSRAGNFQEQIDLAAEGTGLLSREIGALIKGAENVGRTFEQITPSIDIFVRKLAEARRGVPEAVQAFSAAGVTDLRRPTGAILQQVGASLTVIEDPAERSRVAFELFGRSFRTVSQIITRDLKGLGDAALAQGTVFEGALEGVGRKADIEGDRIKGAITGIQNSIAVGLAEHGGNALTKFFADAFEGFAQFLVWVNRSNEELGHFLVGIEKGRPAARFVPGKLLTENFYGDAYTRYNADNPGIGTGPMQGPGMFSISTSRDMYGNLATFGPTVEEAKKALADLARATAEATKAEQGRVEFMRGEVAEIQALALEPPGFKFRDQSAFFGGTGTIMRRPEALSEKSLEKFREDEENAKKGLAETRRQSEQFLAAMAQTLSSGFTNFVMVALTGIGSMKSAFNSLAQSVLETLVQAGVKAGLTALIPGIGQFLQTGGTVAMASGGSVAYAQGGIIASGMRGVDSNLIAAGYGETMIVDHTTTDGLKQLVPQLLRAASQGGGARPTVVNLHFGADAFRIDSGLNDPMVVRELAEKLVLEIPRAIRYGTARKVA